MISSALFVKAPQKFKLFISPYSIEWVKGVCLSGTLCAFDFGSSLKGYSDFLPWPSLGEKTLTQQLEDVKKGFYSERFQVARHNAFIDAQARKQKQHLFFALNIPPSHFLIENLCQFKESPLFTKINLLQFKTVKVKLKELHKNQQIKILNEINEKFSTLNWRLDLNGLSWRDWHKELSFLSPQIEFIEDPAPHTLKNFSVYAEDWISCSQALVKIVKPSRDSLTKIINNLSRWKRVVFTHSFDHPLGQVVSVFWAGVFYKLYPGFCNRAGFLDLQKQSGANFNRAYLKPPQGFGFGFGSLLAQEKWRELT